MDPETFPPEPPIAETAETPIPNPTPLPRPEPSRLGLAVAALVLGVVSIPLSVALIGGLAGLVGLFLALAHIIWRPRERRGMAIAGVILSVMGMTATVGMGTLYYKYLGEVISTLAGGRLKEWEGVEAPDFAVTTLDGKTFRLSDFRGKRVIVDSWATWCGPCVEEMPHFNKLRSDVPEDQLAIVGVSKESESDIRKFLETHRMDYPAASTNSLPAPYSKVVAIPTTFFVDRNGIIQSVLVGYRGFDVLKEHSTGSDYQGESKPQPTTSKDSD
jgi:peroxiredoxin